MLTLIGLVRSDLCRYSEIGLHSFFVNLAREPAFRVITLFRLCKFLKARSGAVAYVAYIPFRFMFKRGQIRFGISLPLETKVGPGFYIGHYGGIVINGRAVIGKNCNISQGVTIGQTNRGSRQGVPLIGDSVYIGPGAKIIGGVSIGNHAAIGANAVVTKDVPENGVAVGIPARIISLDGATGYVNRTDYPPVEY